MLFQCFDSLGTQIPRLIIYLILDVSLDINFLLNKQSLSLIKKEVTPPPTLYHRASHAWFDLSFHFTSFLPASLPQRHRRHFPSLMTLRVVLKFIWFSRFLLLITILHCLTPYNTLCKWKIYFSIFYDAFLFHFGAIYLALSFSIISSQNPLCIIFPHRVLLRKSWLASTIVQCGSLHSSNPSGYISLL